MKTFQFTQWVSVPVLAAVFVSSLSLPCLAGEGGTSSGGGDSFAIEFQSTGYSLTQSLSRVRHPSLPRQAFSQLKDKLAQVVVTTTDEPLLIQGQEKDCINRPSANWIQCNRARIRDAWANESAKKRLVLHEYLSIIGIEGNNDYSVTIQLLKDGAPSVHGEEIFAAQSVCESAVARVQAGEAGLEELRNASVMVQTMAKRAWDRVLADFDRGMLSSFQVRDFQEHVYRRMMALSLDMVVASDRPTEDVCSI